MLKWLGMILLFLGSAGTGFCLSRGLSQRTERILLIQKLLLRLSNDLSYQKTPTVPLLRELSREECSEKLTFLKEFRDLTAQTVSISSLWNAALDTQQNLQKEERELLRETGRILGASDSESQRNAFLFQQKKLELLFEEAMQKQQIQGKLFRSMGVLAGFLLVILTF